MTALWAAVLVLGALAAVGAVTVVRLRADVTKLLVAVAVHERDLTAERDRQLIGGGS